MVWNRGHDEAKAERERHEKGTLQAEQRRQKQQQRKWGTEAAKAQLDAALVVHQQAKAFLRLYNPNQLWDHRGSTPAIVPLSRCPTRSQRRARRPPTYPALEINQATMKSASESNGKTRTPPANPSSTSSYPTSRPTPSWAESPKCIDDPGRYEWEKQMLRNILE